MWWRNVTLVYGIVFLAIGIAGFIPALLSQPIDPAAVAPDAQFGRLFGLFPVNALHNIVHLAFGLWGFFAYFSGRLESRTFLRAVAIIYGALAVLGLIPGLNTLFGLVPLHGHDIWLHAALAIVAGYVGYAVKEPERAGTPARPRV